MQDFHLLDSAIAALEECGASSCKSAAANGHARPGGEHIGHAHGAKIANQAVERPVGKFDPVNIDHRIDEARLSQKPRQTRRLDSRVDMGRRAALAAIGREHRPAQSWKALPAGNGAKQQAAGPQHQMQRGSGQRQAIGGIEQANRQTEIEAAGSEWQRFEVGAPTAGSSGHERAGIDHLQPVRLQPIQPLRVRTAGEQHVSKDAADVGEPVQAIVEGAVVKHGLNADPRGTVAAKGAEAMVEQGAWHEGACAMRRPRRQDANASDRLALSCRRPLAD